MNKKLYLLVLLAVAYLVPVHFASEISAPKFVNVAQAQVATPTHLTIPNAKVDANVIEIGITREGNLDVPGNYTEVGWYKYGTRPGEIGSAVLDGHVDNGGKIPGPFKQLRNVTAGDDIYVSLSDGTVQHYKVKLADVYATNKFPGEMVFHETGDRYLKIITCHGKYVPKLGTYDQRLIVTAVFVETL
jgi:sortase A